MARCFGTGEINGWEFRGAWAQGMGLGLEVAGINEL